MLTIETQAVEKISAIWAEVLGVPEVQPDDNFFALGGDSLIVTIMVMQVEQAFDRVINPDVVFEAPTLAGFCAALFPRS